MRLVDRKTFLSLPSGTVYAYGRPHAYSGWQVKLDTCPNGRDWLFDDLGYGALDNESTGDFVDKMDAMLEKGASFPMEFHQTDRDGCFSEDDLYVIMERADIHQLIERLRECLQPC
ncbi:MAG: hypothetical protein WC869_00705 [Phycisphaerae bacterium]|jgi:hypothetical protein